MKATGLIRRIDDLGRVVIPKEIRRTLHIHEGDALEIFMTDDGEDLGVIFKKHTFAQDISSELKSVLTVLRGQNPNAWFYAIDADGFPLWHASVEEYELEIARNALLYRNYQEGHHDKQTIMAVPVIADGEVWVCLLASTSADANEIRSSMRAFARYLALTAEA